GGFSKNRSHVITINLHPPARREGRGCIVFMLGWSAVVFHLSKIRRRSGDGGRRAVSRRRDTSAEMIVRGGAFLHAPACPGRDHLTLMMRHPAQSAGASTALSSHSSWPSCTTPSPQKAPRVQS